ncbi:MAG: hypothetical protein ACOX7O_09350 [Oscillospiraceae bacterium]|jgi:hypothetical protein
MDDITDNIEKRIDSWLYDMLDEKVPRNSYIYHCNLAYIDILIDQKILFTPFEKHYLFSLSYNTHIAHLKLKEESAFDYRFNRKMYAFAFNMVIRGMQYSMLCDIFPLLHSKKATMQMLGNDIKFDVKKLPKKNFKYIEDYSIRKALSYTLQIANGKLQNSDDESIAMQLSNIYTSFWNENMLYEDYEPYIRLDWGELTAFSILLVCVDLICFI